MPAEALSRKNFDAFYIPMGLLVLGTAIVKTQWTPYAFVVTCLLGAYKFWTLRMSPARPSERRRAYAHGR